jgi:hypothetical protein
MISYEVMDEETAMNERFQLLSEGEYDAVVAKSEDKISASSGNAMMDLTLSVYDAEGKTHAVRDFLVFTKSMMWKVIHFADSAGLSSQYSAQRLCSREIKENRVRVKIGVEEGKEIPSDKLNGKPLGSRYPSKNKVIDYVKRSEQQPLNHSVPEDEDVPF